MSQVITSEGRQLQGEEGWGWEGLLGDKNDISSSAQSREMCGVGEKGLVGILRQMSEQGGRGGGGGVRGGDMVKEALGR